MSHIGGLLHDKTPIEQARWWLRYHLAHSRDAGVNDHGVPEISSKIESVAETIEEMIELKIKTAIDALPR